MILAAGLGTRLKPLTDNIPKALIKYKSVPLISYQIKRLKSIGVDEIVVNTHHFATILQEYLASESKKVGIKISSIYEPKILGTGGGILNAGRILVKSDISIICNVDIFINFNLKKMIEFHLKNKPLSTILIQKRKTTRYLEFDKDLRLIGRGKNNLMNENYYAFNGIHIISREFFKLDIPIEYSDIIDIYLNLIGNGHIILGFDAGKSLFKDLGKPENLK